MNISLVDARPEFSCGNGGKQEEVRTAFKFRKFLHLVSYIILWLFCHGTRPPILQELLLMQKKLLLCVPCFFAGLYGNRNHHFFGYICRHCRGLCPRPRVGNASMSRWTDGPTYRLRASSTGLASGGEAYFGKPPFVVSVRKSWYI